MQAQSCPTCGRAALAVFFEMYNVPVHCNVLWPSQETAVASSRGDIRLGFCRACGMVYNVAFDPGLLSYTQAYENSLHGSPRFQEYATALASHLVDTYALRGKDIIEIGCGKGEFLALLCSTGAHRGVGFDTSYDGSREVAGNGMEMTIIPDLYSDMYADYTADLICSRHVLEHIATPRTFLNDIRQIAGQRPASVVYVEVPNALYTLRDLGIWDIIYEHCSYFSGPSLARLFCETGFFPHDIYTAFGDQFLCLEASLTACPVASRAEVCPDLAELQELIARFADHYHHKVALWSEHVTRWLQQGRQVAVWGAGSKGVTFLNTVAGGEGIRHVIDINPHKQGMYVAGTGQQIMPPEWLRGSRTDTILIMNPLYEDEIRQYLAELGLQAELQVVS